MEIDVLKIIGSEATGMHSIVEEILKNGGNSIIDWLLRIFKRAEWDGDNNVEHMWVQVKWAMVESAREV